MSHSTLQDRRRIYLVGRPVLQNFLLRERLALELYTPTSLISLSQIEISQDLPEENFFLIDGSDLAPHDLFQAIVLLNNHDQPSRRVSTALFNVDATLESFLLDRYEGWSQFKGLFNSDCSSDQFVSGIKAILNNDYWLPRKFYKVFIDRSGSKPTSDLNEVTLTLKEMEILKIVALGRTNIDIAKELNISPHTVKTHIYNLYKKINVTNRTEAAQWLQQHNN